MIRDMVNINMELYKVFYVAATSGNITAAADKLCLSQPSVTKHIQKLESQLGCELFIRSKKGISLTVEGQLLLSRIEPAWHLMLSAERELEAMNSLETGTVTIASTEMSFKSYVLPSMIEYMKKHPKVNIRFSNELNPQMIDMLRNGSIDLAILHTPFRVYDFMDVLVLDEMVEYAVCGLQYKDSIKPNMTPQELRNFPFVSMPQGSSTTEYLKTYFSEHGIDFTPDIELTSVDLTVQAVESGLGIGILPEHIVRPKLTEGSILHIPLKYALPLRRVCLITNRKLPISVAAKSFIDHLTGNISYPQTNLM